MIKNPLLQKSTLPKFDKILPKHFKPAIADLIKNNHAKIKKLLSQKNITWNNFVSPFEEANENLISIWSVISHLNNVNGTKDIRDAYNACLPLVTKYAAEISQNLKIYQAFDYISQGKESAKLNSTQKKILDDKLRDFFLAGVTLPKKKKDRFTKLKRKLAELSNKFSCNVLDSTQNYSITLTKKETRGLPEAALLLGQTNAEKKNQKGFLFTLDYPSYHALITFADSRTLRKKIYIAYVTRASDIYFNKKWDNSKTIEEILKIRTEFAKTLSFSNYAEYSLATKMAKDSSQVLNFLNDLAKKSLPHAKKEFKELQKFAKKHGIKEIKPWDIPYYEEKLRQEKHQVAQEELRPYFPEHHVTKGIFSIVKKLYGITFKEKKDVPIWHKDVRFFEVYDQKKNLQGRLYLDLYSRDNKRGGAWMDECRTRYLPTNGKLQIPAAYLICNFSPPTNKKPALLTHEDLLTFLHELGHCLQHVLTKIDYLAASGINGVPWDGVEIASQVMENWGWEKEGLKILSKHYETKKTLPNPLLKKLIATKTFHAGIYMLRQLEFSLIDFNLHLKQAPKIKQIKEITKEVQKKTRITPTYKYARFLHAFTHIFGGAYAAGYYSYKWAEVLSADAFSKFAKHGIFSRKIGKEFLHRFLEAGGSEDPLALFEKFRGRPPKINSLLKYYGIDK